MGSWEKSRGNEILYIPEQFVRPPFSNNLTNLNTTNLVNSDIELYAPNTVDIYDLTKATPQVMGTIYAREYMSLVKENREYWTILVGGRIGHVRKEEVVVGPVINHVTYAKTFNEALSIQMTRSPQTDLYRSQASYVHKDFVTVNPLMPTDGVVNSASLNVRELANTSSWIVGKLVKGEKVKILSTSGEWYQIPFGPWKNAKMADVQTFSNPDTIKQDAADFYQFLVLSKNAGMRASDLNNKILVDKGVLANKGQVFVDTSYDYNINEVYLIAHSLLETGNGKSELATGVLVSEVKGQPVPPKIVHNMFGIRAVDSCPIKCGAEYAYEQGWFTPELAIKGGAKFISEQYVNNPTYKQDTLYKMRWNPNMPGTHQYATDIGWAKKQVPNIKKLYDLVEQYNLYFEIPHYQ
jgi:mannosyl-glycoprotein endo-beta-N-acetylglucosaminidase